jgi:hypothetical protein
MIEHERAAIDRRTASPLAVHRVTMAAVLP